MSAAVDALAPVLGRSPRILVIRLRRFGDLLLITPTLRAIRTTYPEARLDVLASAGFHQVLVGNPHLDALLVLEPGGAAWRRMVRRCYRGGYDAVLLELRETAARFDRFVLSYVSDEDDAVMRIQPCEQLIDLFCAGKTGFID